MFNWTHKRTLLLYTRNAGFSFDFDVRKFHQTAINCINQRNTLKWTHKSITPYEALHLESSNASLSEIKKSYYKLSRIYHPDMISAKIIKETETNPNETDNNIQSKINIPERDLLYWHQIHDAYMILSNPESKNLYDQYFPSQSKSSSSYSTTSNSFDSHSFSHSRVFTAEEYNAYRRSAEKEDFDSTFGSTIRKLMQNKETKMGISIIFSLISGLFLTLYLITKNDRQLTKDRELEAWNFYSQRRKSEGLNYSNDPFQSQSSFPGVRR